jgi:hypothetical protein
MAISPIHLRTCHSFTETSLSILLLTRLPDISYLLPRDKAHFEGASTPFKALKKVLLHCYGLFSKQEMILGAKLRLISRLSTMGTLLGFDRA